MEWIYFLRVAEWKDVHEGSQISHSVPFEEEKDPVPPETPYTGDLFEGYPLLPHRMET